MARQEIDVNVNVNSKQAQTNLNTVSKDLDKVADSTKEVKSEFQEMPGVLGQAQKGVAGLGKAFKALLANPVFLVITALVTAVTALGKAFTKTKEGADKTEMVLGKIGAVLDVLVKRVGQFAGGLLKLFTGDIKGGLEQMKSSFTDIGTELQGIVSLTEQYILLQRQMTETQIKNSISVAEWRKQLAEQLLISRDMNKSVQERTIAINKAFELETKIYEARVQAQNEAVALAALEINKNTQAADIDDKRLKLAQELAAQKELETSSLNAQRELKNRLNTLDAEALAMAKEQARLQQEAIAARQIDEEKISSLGIDPRIKREQEVTDELLKMETAYVSDFKKLEESKWAGAVLATNAGLDILAGLAEGNVAAEKAINVAKAIMNTYTAATVALASAPPPYNFILMGATIAAGAIQVAKIISTKPGDRTVTGQGTSIPQAATQAQEVINAPPELAQNVNVMNQNNQPPLRAYVVSRDMSSQQDLDRRISDQASL